MANEVDKRKDNTYDGIINNAANIIQTSVEIRKNMDINGLTQENVKVTRNYLMKIVTDASQIIYLIEKINGRRRK